MKADENGTSVEPANFRINSSYEQFTARQKSLFDQLNMAEHNTRNLLCHNNAPMDVEDPSLTYDLNDSSRRSFARNEINMRQFRGKESIFKKPQARAPKGLGNRRTPDYQVNPHKWTRYSLDDVKSEDMSERANTAAAMSFLKEMELRKNQGEVESDDGERPQRIIFKKTSQKVENKKSGGKPTSTTVFQNSKVVMPEYVVGQKVKKEQKRKEKKIGSNNTGKIIKLGHLDEEEEDN